MLIENIKQAAILKDRIEFFQARLEDLKRYDCVIISIGNTDRVSIQSRISHYNEQPAICDSKSFFNINARNEIIKMFERELSDAEKALEIIL